MCDCDDVEYTEFPSRIIGGPTGNYELAIDVPSNQWGEFLVVNIGNGAGIANVVISGNSPTAVRTLDYSGATTLNKDNSMQGIALTAAANTSIFAPMIFWERIQHSQKKVFVRIDVTAGACFLTIRFRIAKLKIIPGPAVTGDPNHMADTNAARAEATRQRLGLNKEIAQGEGINAAKPRAKMEDMMHGQR